MARIAHNCDDPLEPTSAASSSPLWSPFADRCRSIIVLLDVTDIVNSSCIVAECNRSFALLAGQPKNLIVGRPFADFLVPEDAAATIRALEAAGFNCSRECDVDPFDETYSLAIRMPHPSGRISVVNLCLSGATENDRHYLIVTGSNVTARASGYDAVLRVASQPTSSTFQPKLYQDHLDLALNITHLSLGFIAELKSRSGQPADRSRPADLFLTLVAVSHSKTMSDSDPVFVRLQEILSKQENVPLRHTFLWSVASHLFDQKVLSSTNPPNANRRLSCSETAGLLDPLSVRAYLCSPINISDKSCGVLVVLNHSPFISQPTTPVSPSTSDSFSSHSIHDTGRPSTPSASSSSSSSGSGSAGSTSSSPVGLRSSDYHARKMMQFLSSSLSFHLSAAHRALLPDLNELIKIAFDLSYDLIAVTRGDLRIQKANPAFYNLLGYTEEEITSTDYTTFLHPDDVNRTPDEVKQMVPTEPGCVLNRWKHKVNGDWRWIQWRVVSDPKNNFVTGIGRDVTDEIRLKTDMQTAKRLAEEAASAKSQFLVNMSHEIRTPMNGVMGMTALLLQTALSHEQRELANAISVSADHLLTVINDILDLSKIESGRTELVNDGFHLYVVIEQSIDLSLRSEHEGVRIAYAVSPDVPVLLMGDCTRLRQILTNLISNALKFTTPPGDVVVSVRKLPPPDNTTISDDTFYLEFSVKDTGCGIPLDKQDKLFKPFSQADASISREFGGTGLGLAISKRLAGLMGGDAWLHSDGLGHGSTFFFSIRTRPNTKQTLALPLFPSKRALVVSSDDLHVPLLSTVLSNWKFDSVLVAPTIESALSILNSGHQPFEVIIVDVDTPEIPQGNPASSQLEFEPADSKAESADVTKGPSPSNPNTASPAVPKVEPESPTDRLLGYLRESKHSDRTIFLLSSGQAVPRKSPPWRVRSRAASVTLEKETILKRPIKWTVLYTKLLQVFGLYSWSDRERAAPNFLVKSLPCGHLPVLERNEAQRTFAVSGGGDLSLLVVEDQPINRRLAQKMLEKAGFPNVPCAADGFLALEAVKKQHFDIIFMDVQMPVMNGLESTRAIRDWYVEHGHGKTAPVIIAMTANAMKGDREMCIAAGMNDYISKPINFEVVLDKLSFWSHSNLRPTPKNSDAGR